MENGAVRQEVPHAHLHAMPFTPTLSRDWVDGSALKKMKNWEDVWQECEQAGSYCYFETNDERYILNQNDQYQVLLKEMRIQLIAQTAVEIAPGMEGIRRGGKEMVDETMRIWKVWAQNNR
jgi:hypothetical protein